MPSQHAPIAFFVYNRPDHTALTLEALLKNPGVDQTALYVFSDGPKSAADEKAVAEVRALFEGLSGFKSVELIASDTNKGLANSIIGGVTRVVSEHGRVIVFEDDLVSHPLTLDYFNRCLDHFEPNQGVFSVSGFAYPEKIMTIPEDYEYDVYAIPRMQCWGWATWADRWEKADFSVPDFGSFNNSASETGAYTHWIGGDSLNTLRLCMAGEKDVWACRWVYTHFRNHAVCICPTDSYINNIGLDGSGANCGTNNRFYNALETEKHADLRLPDLPFVDPRIFDAFMGVVDPSRKCRLEPEPSAKKGAAETAKVAPASSQAHPPAQPGPVRRVMYWGSRPRHLFNTLVIRMKKWLLSKLTKYSNAVHKQVQSRSTIPLARLGTNYGGWWVPESGLGPDDVIVSAGAGEDISFDVELANRFGCKILIVDPTPRAAKHFEETRDLVRKGEPAPINHNPDVLYEATADTFAKMEYFPVGLWDKVTKVQFFEPANKNHVSHSIDNLHKTGDGFEAEVITLDELMKRANVDDIRVLKMDIEGAEFAVIDAMLKSSLRPWYLLIEFHAGTNNFQKATKMRTASYLKKLSQAGYKLVANRDWDYVFELQN